MPAILTLLAFLTGLILLSAAFFVYHLFFRDRFKPPAGLHQVTWRTCLGAPFLLEHGLPYPSGIQSTQRRVLSLDGAWQFRLDGASTTSQVEIPSCFNTADSSLRDYLGAVWYERSFSLPEALLDEARPALLRLAFLGSFYRTQVWLDGDPLGAHEGGYLPFYFDLAGRISPGKEHHLSVCVDNRPGPDTLPPLLFQGHNLGWQPYGGLHRSVYIEICPPQYCFKLALEPEIIAQQGRLGVSALFHRIDETAATLDAAHLRLLDPQGRLLAEAGAPITWGQGAQFGALSHTFTVPSPLLWAPGSPQLYRLEVASGLDQVASSFGFRTIQARQGELLLNGNSLLLKGVCRHQEERRNGLAQAPQSIQGELEAIQDLGGNFVRLAHYPHASETLELCDRLGLCAWDEIPLYQAGLGVIRFLFDKTRHARGKTLTALLRVLWNTNLLENPHLMLKARDELLKMIERDRNHPALLFWGLGNECWTLNPSGEKALSWLRSEGEALDRSRLWTYSVFSLPYLTKLFERAFRVTDVAALNEYFGWYYGKVQDTRPFLQALAKKFPHKPLMVTETGADAAAGVHSGEMPPPRGYSEEYQAWLLEQQWRQMRAVPGFAGLSIWVLKDFLCPEYREDNIVPFYNLKGLFDRDGQPKASYNTVKGLYHE